MCWSRGVSAAFACAEALGLAVLIRLARGKAGAVRFTVPLLASVLAIEVVEALVWPEVSTTPDGCGALNRAGTTAAYCVLSLQPLLVNVAARMIEPDRELFRVTTAMASALAASFLGALVAGEVFELELRAFGDTRGLGMHNVHTCSLLGRRGHLHWVFKVSSHFLAPSGFSYLFMMLPALWSRPRRVLAAPLLAYLVVFGLCFGATGWSFEAGSVWCWTAAGWHAYGIALCWWLSRRAVS